MAALSSSTSQDPTTACRDGCGRTITDAELERSGWTFLAIARRWRCPECARALASAALLPDAPAAPPGS